ncbi:hypothetical protein D3C75_752220 [compost metagenome]
MTNIIKFRHTFLLNVSFLAFYVIIPVIRVVFFGAHLLLLSLNLSSDYRGGDNSEKESYSIFQR